MSGMRGSISQFRIIGGPHESTKISTPRGCVSFAQKTCRARSAQNAKLVHRPVNKNGFAVDVLARDGAKIAAITRGAAMVAENEVTALRNYDCRERAKVLEPERHVRLVDSSSVHVHAAIIDANPIASHRNHSLDVALGWISGVMENNNIARRNTLEVVNELVDKNAFLVLQSRKHAGSFDLHGLI